MVQAVKLTSMRVRRTVRVLTLLHYAFRDGFQVPSLLPDQALRLHAMPSNAFAPGAKSSTPGIISPSPLKMTCQATQACSL